MSDKLPFDLNLALLRIEAAVAPFPKAAMFELFERGYTSLFEQLIACIISIRTYDEVSLPTALQLFATARTPAAMIELRIDQIDALIHNCTFHERKAEQIHTIAGRIMHEYAGELPADREILLSLAGVGPKCANLALGIGSAKPYISVDIHVHRITNRWGYVHASTPEVSLAQLERRVAHAHWTDINRLLVPFGKHICTGSLPHCSTCPVLNMCQQVGVTATR